MQVLGGWLLGMLLVAAVGWALLRSNGLHDYHKTPMLSMVLGLMLACGWVGWYSLAGLGGHQQTWLILWESWVLLHLLAVCYPIQLSYALAPSKRAGGPPESPLSTSPQDYTPGWANSASSISSHQQLEFPAGPVGSLQSAPQRVGHPLVSGDGSSGREMGLPGQVGLERHPAMAAVAAAATTEAREPRQEDGAPSATLLWVAWQHCKLPLYCILMGTLLPALTGWLPFQLMQPDSPWAEPSAQIRPPHEASEWVDIPLEPNW